MYIKTDRAAVWIDDGAQTPKPGSTAQARPFHPSVAAQAQPSAPSPIRWARRPWPNPLGECLGLRQEAQGMAVALRSPGGSVRWLSVREVLTETQLKRWVASGF